MAFDIDMIKAVYARLENRVAEARKLIKLVKKHFEEYFEIAA